MPNTPVDSKKPAKKSQKRVSAPHSSGIRTRRKRPLCKLDLTENSLKRAEAANQDGTLGKLDDLTCRCGATVGAEVTLTRGIKPTAHSPARRHTYVSGKDTRKRPPR
jgi:hypothetical protein